MPALTIEGLDEAAMSSLAAIASGQGKTVEEWARELLTATARAREMPPLIDRLRALRAQGLAAEPLASVGIIRAEREARMARILGEDEGEAWARGYREAIGSNPPAASPAGEAA